MESELTLKREDRENTVNEMKALAAKAKEEKRSFTDDEIARYDELHKVQKELANEIATLERSERLKDLLPPNPHADRTAPAVRISRAITRDDHNNSLKAWLVNGKCEPKDDWKRSCDKLNVNWQADSFDIVRDQTSDVAGEGKNATNDSMFQALEVAKKAFGGVESVSTVIRTSTGEGIHFATVDDTASAPVYSAQAETVSNVGMSFGKVVLSSYEIKTAVYPVSLSLIEDASFDVLSFIGGALGQRLGRALNQDFTTGVGTTEPTGFTASTTQGTTGYSNLLSDENLYDLYFSVDAAYRNSPNCVWMMNDSTLNHLCQRLQDTTGQPIWGPGMDASPSLSLLGKPIVINNDMDTMAPGEEKTPIAFGDFAAYKIRYAGNTRILRANERWIDQLSVGILAYARVDGKLVDAGQAPIKHLTTGTLSGDS